MLINLPNEKVYYKAELIEIIYVKFQKQIHFPCFKKNKPIFKSFF